MSTFPPHDYTYEDQQTHSWYVIWHPYKAYSIYKHPERWAVVSANTKRSPGPTFILNKLPDDSCDESPQEGELSSYSAGPLIGVMIGVERQKGVKGSRRGKDRRGENSTVLISF